MTGPTVFLFVFVMFGDFLSLGQMDHRFSSLRGFDSRVYQVKGHMRWCKVKAMSDLSMKL